MVIKKIVRIFDEKLNKSILIGNENIKNLDFWESKLNEFDLVLDHGTVEYIRFYPPFVLNGKNFNSVISREQNIWKKNPFLKKFFFHGINFIADNITPSA